MSRFGPLVPEATLLAGLLTHKIIKETLAQSLGEKFIQTAVLYGGSVKPENAKELLSHEEISLGLWSVGRP